MIMRILYTGVFLLILGINCSAFAQIQPSISANGHNSELVINDDENLSISARLQISDEDNEADWWVLLKSQDRFYHLNLATGQWESGIEVSYQGRLAELPMYEIFNAALPSGEYTYYFGVDLIKNGRLDMDDTYYDSISIKCVSTDSLVLKTIVLPNSMNYRMPMNEHTTCIELIIPININNDVWQDFFVLYSERVWPQGSEFTGPPPEGIVAYVSNGDGTYRIGNQEVFGTNFPQLGGITGHYAKGDMNNDGRDDFAFGMNWEDGRFNENWSVCYTEDTILLSEPGGQYSIHRVGYPAWTFAASVINNSEGSVDFLFNGTSREHRFQAFRYINGEFVDVVDEYNIEGNEGWDGGVYALPNKTGAFETTQFVATYGDWEAGEYGIALYTRTGEGWELTDKSVWTSDFDVDFLSWSAVIGTRKITVIDGVAYEGVMIHRMSPNIEYDSRTNKTTIFAGMISNTLKDGIFEPDSGIIYDEGDTLGRFNILKYTVVDNRIVRENSNIHAEYSNVGESFFEYKDLNSDGYSDLIVSPYTQPWVPAHVELGGLPVVYLNDKSGGFRRLDLSNYPKHSDSLLPLEGQSSLKGMMVDVNGDGVEDLISFTINKYSGDEVIEINLLRDPIH